MLQPQEKRKQKERKRKEIENKDRTRETRNGYARDRNMPRGQVRLDKRTHKKRERGG